MEVEEQIIRELYQVPRQHYHEILDFIREKKKNAGKIMGDTVLASESSLKKDWLRHEEDEAWADL
ncbi:hypothetical protein [Methanoregula sp.]|uniref:hypothetical protein n=1 Tax=Methanoregula sp. TaxID=2052170 RepID=UPI003562DB00